MGQSWTAESYLPGGEADFDGPQLATRLQQQCPWLSRFTVERLATNYGSYALKVLEGVSAEADMGQHFGEGSMPASWIT